MRLSSIRVGHGDLPMVFVHGLFGQGRNWRGIAQALGDEATSLLVDAPNHGRSPWTDAFDYDDFAECIYRDVTSQEGFESFVLVGHSMGGKIAMRMALRHPEAIRVLVVVDISPISGHVGSEFPSLVAAMRSLDLHTLANRREADERLAPLIRDDRVRAFLLQNLHHDRNATPEWSWRMNLNLLGDSLDLVSQWPPTSATYEGPVLWLGGQNSPYIQPEHVPLMRGLFPRARLVKVRGAGHWLHSERPEAFLASLRAYLALNLLG